MTKIIAYYVKDVLFHLIILGHSPLHFFTYYGTNFSDEKQHASRKFSCKNVFKIYPAEILSGKNFNKTVSSSTFKCQVLKRFTADASHHPFQPKPQFTSRTFISSHISYHDNYNFCTLVNSLIRSCTFTTNYSMYKLHIISNAMKFAI